MSFNTTSNAWRSALAVVVVVAAVGCGKTSLTDGQIFGILKTANDGQISAGQRAPDHAQGASVKTYADSVVTTDTDANARQEALAVDQGITPVTSTSNTSLQSANDSVIVKLTATPDSAFDSQYLTESISLHQTFLDLLNNDMIPDAHNASLKAELSATLATVTAQQTDAKAIQAQ